MTIDILRIDHPTGYLHISIDRFFPCPVRKASKIFRLACLYCSDEHLEDLRETLQLQAKRLEEKEGELKDRLVLAPSRSEEHKDATIQINRIKRERAQLERNIRELDIRRGMK